MKKFILFAFLLALFTTNTFAIIGNIGSSTALDYSGAVKSETLEKIFINVRNSHSSSISAGQVATLDLSDDDGASVDLSASSGLSPLCIMVSSCAVGALCKCQTYGLFDTALFDSTMANAVAGKRFYMSTNNAGYIAARNTDLVSEVSGGVFYDAASASGSVQVFIKL